MVLHCLERCPTQQHGVNCSSPDFQTLPRLIKNGYLHSTVGPHDNGQYAVVVGHLRLMAAPTLGWDTATLANWDRETQTRVNYMENRHRVSVSPYDDAKRAVVDIMGSRGWSPRKMAAYLGDNLSRLSGLVRIYRNLPLLLALEERIPLRWLRSARPTGRPRGRGEVCGQH